MTLYATVEFTQQIMRGDTTATTPSAEANIYAALMAVSRRVDMRMAGPRRRPAFAPYIETRRYPVAADRVSSAYNTYLVPHPMLSLDGISLGTETLTVGTHVEVYPDGNQVPFYELRLMQWDRLWYDYPTANGAPLTVAITGTWGYHPDVATAWQAVDKVANSTLTASATSLAVTDIAAEDVNGRSPRIGRGSLLKIGNEYLEVTSVNPSDNTATVQRGVNGSTAADHDENAIVYAWIVDEPLRRAVARQAAYQVSRLGSYNTTEVRDLGVEIRYPSDLLPELSNLLQEYQWAM